MKHPGWYLLDGIWHNSVASRISKLHRSTDAGMALCRPDDLILNVDDEYGDREVKAGWAVCSACVKKAKATP